MRRGHYNRRAEPGQLDDSIGDTFVCISRSHSSSVVVTTFRDQGESTPDPKKFAYTFDHIAEVMEHFTEALGLSRFSLYMQDYGGPVGFRMILAHPERVECRLRSRTTKAWELTGRPGARFGPTERRTKAPYERIFPLWPRLERVTPVVIRTSTTRICGRTNIIF
jgi:pimeloyl-ACP methyl ester carboxylesterase